MIQDPARAKVGVDECLSHSTGHPKGKAAPFPQVSARLSEIPSRLLLPKPREGKVVLLLSPCDHSCPLSCSARTGEQPPGSGI